MGKTTIDLLRDEGVTEQDLLYFELHMKGGEENTFTNLGKKYKKSPVTISRRVRKVQKALKKLEAGVKPGDVSLQSKGLEKPQPPAVQGAAPGKLALPTENPFLALQAFSDLSGITNATGSVLGLGLATMHRAWTREDLPYEERQVNMMQGASVIAGTFLSMYLTFNKFSKSPAQEVNAEVKEG